jgi:hypothetical protein
MAGGQGGGCIGVVGWVLAGAAVGTGVVAAGVVGSVALGTVVVGFGGGDDGEVVGGVADGFGEAVPVGALGLAAVVEGSAERRPVGAVAVAPVGRPAVAGRLPGGLGVGWVEEVAGWLLFGGLTDVCTFGFGCSASVGGCSVAQAMAAIRAVRATATPAATYAERFGGLFGVREVSGVRPSGWVAWSATVAITDSATWRADGRRAGSFASICSSRSSSSSVICGHSSRGGTGSLWTC